jgi:hypothetical protein
MFLYDKINNNSAKSIPELLPALIKLLTQIKAKSSSSIMFSGIFWSLTFLPLPLLNHNLSQFLETLFHIDFLVS